MAADARDRTDVTAQVIATEAIALALAKFIVVGMSAQQKQAFAADVTANLAAICDAMAVQAPALARAKGLNPKAGAAAAATIAEYAKAHIEQHLADLIGQPAAVPALPAPSSVHH